MTLVEFAFVAPIFFLLLMGMVDFGFAYGDYISLRNGVREGARYAATNPDGSDTCVLDAAAPDDQTEHIVCVTKERIGIDEDDVRVAIVVGDGDVGDSVIVCAETAANSTSGITEPFLKNTTISSESEMRIEVGATYSDYNEGGVSCS